MANYAIRFSDLNAAMPNNLVGPTEATTQSDHTQHQGNSNFADRRNNNRRDNYRGSGHGQ